MKTWLGSLQAVSYGSAFVLWRLITLFTCLQEACLCLKIYSR